MTTRSFNILTVLEEGGWTDWHLAGSFEDMGHHVTRFQYGAYVGEFYGSDRKEERVLKNRQLVDIAENLARSGKLDLIFCYVYDDFLLTETAFKLSQFGVPMVNYNVDMVNQWYRQSSTAKYFTLNLCAHKSNITNLARYANKALYFPMAGRLMPSNNSLADNYSDETVTFVGTPESYRKRVLKKLIDGEIPISIYGKFWQKAVVATPDYRLEKTLSDIRLYALKRMFGEGFPELIGSITDRVQRKLYRGDVYIDSTNIKGFVSDSDITALFRGSKINLGITRIKGRNPDKKGEYQLKLRDFEVPLAGGFYLVEKVEDYGELFEFGKEVETWETIPELLDKIRYYLEHDADRLEIARRGLERAEAQHTWAARFDQLFSELSL